MSNTYELSAKLRERTGKGAARAIRRDGAIPAVIYGGNEPPLSITVDYKTIYTKIYAGGFLTHTATIDVDGKKIRVLPRDYQLDPVRDMPLHVDFLRLAAGSTVTVEVPVHFINELASPGIKRGGVLNIVRHTIEMIVPADAIPDHITCDLTGLDIGDSLHISAVKLPEGARPTITERDFTVATIAAPAGLKEDAPAADAAAAAAPAAAAAKPAAKPAGKG